MISKKAFKDIIDVIESHVDGISQLETCLNVTFDNNFLTKTIDHTIVILGESFFTEEELKDENNILTVNTVVDMIYHFCITCDFGLKTETLKRLYVEDDGLDTEEAFDAYTSEQLYDIIIRYIAPVSVKKTYLINC